MTVFGRDRSRDRGTTPRSDAGLSLADGQPACRIVQERVDPDAVIEQGAELIGAVEAGGLLVGGKVGNVHDAGPAPRRSRCRISGTHSTGSTLV